MADTKISALTALTGANSAADDELVIVDTSATETKKMSRDELQAMVLESVRAAVASNVNLGAGSLPQTATGANNTAVGSSALGSVTSGVSNTMAGSGAGDAITTGSYNNAQGENALGALTTGLGHVAIGRLAAAAYTTQSYGVHIGYTAGQSATGLSAIGIGHAAGFAGAGANNTAIGYLSQSSASRTGASNTSLGSSAMRFVTSGSNNTAIGTLAGDAITTGSFNCAQGRDSLGSLTSGSNNVAAGYNSLGASTTGANNTAIGHQAGVATTTGSNQTLLGNGAAASAPDVDNEITLGNSSVATLRCQVTSITALSDARDKKDINDLELGLDYIQQLRPVSWIWDARDGSRGGGKDFGFIAQDLQKAQEDNNAPWVNAVLARNPDRLEAAPGKLLPIAIKAIQELSEQVQLMKSSLDEQARHATRASLSQSNTISRLQAEIATIKASQ